MDLWIENNARALTHLRIKFCCHNTERRLYRVNLIIDFIRLCGHTALVARKGRRNLIDDVTVAHKIARGSAWAKHV